MSVCMCSFRAVRMTVFLSVCLSVHLPSWCLMLGMILRVSFLCTRMYPCVSLSLRMPRPPWALGHPEPGPCICRSQIRLPATWWGRWPSAPASWVAKATAEFYLERPLWPSLHHKEGLHGSPVCGNLSQPQPPLSSWVTP